MPAEQTPEMAANVSVSASAGGDGGGHRVGSPVSSRSLDNIVAGDAAIAVSLADLADLLAAVEDALPLLKQGPKERAKRDRLESAAAKFQL